MRRESCRNRPKECQRSRCVAAVAVARLKDLIIFARAVMGGHEKEKGKSQMKIEDKTTYTLTATNHDLSVIREGLEKWLDDLTDADYVGSDPEQYHRELLEQI